MTKKLLSLILALIIALSVCVIPASAADPVCDRPIIMISGDSEGIYDSEGNEVFRTRNLKLLVHRWLDENGKFNKDKLIDDLKYIFVPYYLEGCILGPFGNYDKYYDRIYEILSDCFGSALLDKNGNPQEGTSISQARIQQTENCTKINHDTYHILDYQFFYDWRLDPMETADKLKEHIDAVKKTTGYDKVGIICRCLGANVFFAYVSKYGMKDIYGVGMDGVVVNGCELMSQPVSGKFELDINSANRLIIDLNSLGVAKINSDILEAVDAVAETGIVGSVWKYVKFMHWNTVVKGVTSSMSLGTFFTFPNYWGGITAEDYEIAKEYIFGPEGSEKRQEWAGLIAKLDNYDKNVRQRIPEILEEINENANLAIISKYGVQLAPIAKDRDLVGDQIISVKLSSFGATTGTIKEPLSDDYIAKRLSEGKAKYISPDKQIDASTSLYPDQTWFVKGPSHSDWTTTEMDILSKVVCADKQLTVDTLEGYNRFTVYPNSWYGNPDSGIKMTTENCNTENWEIKEYETTKNPIVKLKHFGIGVKRLVDIIFK